MPFEEMAERYFDKYMNVVDNKQNTDKKTHFIKFIVNIMSNFNFIVKPKSIIEQNADKVISKQLLIHLENFFKKGRRKNTRKYKHQIKHKTTRKKHMII